MTTDIEKHNLQQQLLFKLIKNRTDFNSSDIQTVLELGVDPNVKDEHGSTPLHHAAYDLWIPLRVIELLLTHNAEINAKDKNGRTPLYYAVAEAEEYFPSHIRFSTEREEKIRLLINSGADVHDIDVLKFIVYYCSEEVIQLLIEKMNDVNIQNEDGYTLLHLAAASNRIDAVQFLIEKGGTVDIRSKDGSTPLHLAIKKGNIKLAQFLVTHGADAYAKDKFDKTPLDYVTYYACYSLFGTFVGTSIALTYLFTGNLNVYSTISTLIFPAIGALIGFGTAKLYEKITEEKIKDPDISNCTALKNVLTPEYFGSKSCSYSAS